MSKVRMQRRYWMMIHEAITFFIKKEELRLNRLTNDLSKIPAHDSSEINIKKSEISNLRDDIGRYEAIDRLIVSAANKEDGLFESNKGLGPDYVPPPEPEFEEETPEEEFKWRTNDSIGY